MAITNLENGCEEFIPHVYQEDTFELMIHKPAFGVFMQPGLGKTPTSLMVINHFKDRTLLIAPLMISYLVWPTEIEKWCRFNNIKATILHGPDKEKRFLSNNKGLYIINPEGLMWLEKMIIKHKRNPWKQLIIDESAKFKAFNSKRFKILKRMLSMFKRRYILAGNPTPNSYLDLWAQIFILDKGKRLGRTMTAYKRKYFIQTGFRGYTWELKEGAADQIKEAIKDICIFVKATDHLDLPQEVYNDIKFDLPPNIRTLYNTMERKLFAEIENGKAEFNYMEETDGKEVAGTKVNALQKCQQIAQGFLYIHEQRVQEDGEIINVKIGTKNLHSIRIDLLKELVEELNGEPILIGYWFEEDYIRLKEAFPQSVALGKGATMDDNAEIQKDWNNGKIEVLLGSYASVSHGLNLQKAGHNVAFYTMLYNYDQYDQFIKRVLRQGNISDRVIIHRFLARNTIDIAMLQSILSKGTMSADLLEALKLYKKEIINA